MYARVAVAGDATHEIHATSSIICTVAIFDDELAVGDVITTLTEESFVSVAVC